MGTVIDLSKYRNQPGEPPRQEAPFHIVYNDTTPYAIVILPLILIIAPDLASTVANSAANQFEFAVLTSSDMKKMRVLFWDEETGRVHGYEFYLYPSDGFNSIPGFGGMNVQFITFNGCYLGRVANMTREEFINKHSR